MKKRIEKYILFALSAIRAPGSGLIHDVTNPGQVYEEYDGYAASLGAAIITSGLLPALSFYTDIHRSGDALKSPRRFKVLKVIGKILTEDGAKIADSNNGLLEFIVKGNNNAGNKAKILDASIALKLALRNFEHVKSPSNEP